MLRLNAMVTNENPSIAHLAARYSTTSRRFNNEIDLAIKKDEDYTLKVASFTAEDFMAIKSTDGTEILIGKNSSIDSF